MNFRTILPLLGLLLLINVSSAQDITFIQKVNSYTKEWITAEYFIPAAYDVDLYYVEYTTKNIQSQIDTASGVIAIPVDINTVFPILVYEHGTVGNRTDVPSQGSGEATIGVVSASYGYVALLPDYLGLGISKGLHPYIHPESEAWVTLDLIRAAKTSENIIPVHINEQIFITGYSQGGHAAMATCRALQQDQTLNLTAASCMSGPYNVSKEMKKFTMGDEPYEFCAYIASVFLTAKYVYPELFLDMEVEDVFKPEYATLVRLYETEQLDLFDMNDQMIALLSMNGGIIQPNRMFLDDLKNDFSSDPNHPIQIALERMDVYDWVPTAPIRLIYCTADDQVTYRNAVFTDSIMHVNGATSVEAIDVLSSGNHGTCFTPALFSTIFFFNNLQETNPVATNNEALVHLIISPNPAYNELHIKNLNFGNYAKIIRISDILGRTELVDIIPQNEPSYNIDLSSIAEGIKMVQIIDNDAIIYSEKIIVIK